MNAEGVGIYEPYLGWLRKSVALHAHAHTHARTHIHTWNGVCYAFHAPAKVETPLEGTEEAAAGSPQRCWVPALQLTNMAPGMCEIVLEPM